MNHCIRVALAWFYLMAYPVAGQPTVPDVERLHDQALRPAMQALTKNDLLEARRLARVLVVEFEKFPPELQSGQGARLQRLSRMYVEKGLFAEADMLLTRAASAWEVPMMRTPDSPLGPLYADLAKARRLSGKPDDAYALLQRAQALRGTEPRQTDPDAFPIFVEIGWS